MIRKIIYLIFPLLFLVIAFKANAQNTTTGSAQIPNESTTNLKQQIQLTQEQRRNAVGEVRQEAQVMIQAKRKEFKTRIQLIKDQRKKMLVERIDAKITELNKNLIIKFTEVLVKLQGFLNKINKTPVVNPVVVNDLGEAQIAIDAARAAVNAQAAKAYIMEVGDDTSLKPNAGIILSQFRQDLIAVHKLVMDAKQAVQKLNTDKELIKKEATTSAKL